MTIDTSGIPVLNEHTVTEIVAKSPLFQTLGLSEVRRIAALGGEERWPAGTVLSVRGEHAERLYVILDGMIRIPSPITGELTWIMTAPEAYGVSTLVEPHRHLVDAVAATDVHLLAIPTMGLRALIDADDSIGRRLLLETARYLYERMNEMIEQAATHGGPDGLPRD